MLTHKYLRHSLFLLGAVGSARAFIARPRPYKVLLTYRNNFDFLNSYPHFPSSLKAYKLKMFGASYVWLVPGYFSAGWQYVPAEEVSCSPEELLEASEGYVTVTFSMFSISEEFGRCGMV